MSIADLNLQSYYPPELLITGIEQFDDSIIIHMHSKSQEAICHKCGTSLVKHHGTHRRKVQDLPILGKRVVLDMQIFDYQCTSSSCGSFAATETFDGFLSYNSRMTARLEELICSLATETSCEACARIANSMNIKISGDTVIRLLIKKYSQQPTPKCGSVIGVDDFAFKKRHTYGTIVVDEATHKPVAVLDGRDGKSLKEWLQNNRHVRTVTRDRASAYAKAIEEVLPDCMQVADRFHIHQNLMEAVKKALGRTMPVTNPVPEKTNDHPDSTQSKTSVTPSEENGEKKRKQEPKTGF